MMNAHREHQRVTREAPRPGSAEHHWWDWYAPYLGARQNGSRPEEAAAAANRSMEEVLRRKP
jgi:hypothetical protein